MTIEIVRLHSPSDLEIVRAIGATLDGGQRATLATRLLNESPLALTSTDEGGFIETLEPAPRILIAGAGHIGRALARLVVDLEFSVIVQDERPAWLTAAAFPADCELHESLPTAVEALRHWQGERLAALVTRGFPQDVAALNALAAVPDLTYLGLLGSRTRVKTVLAEQHNSGIAAPQETILHAPIGIEIGAETPAEIAVSIAAEIIRIRRRNRESAVRLANAAPPENSRD